MRTSVEYKNNLANGIITKQMLGEAIYSCNKRAKNYRDVQRTCCQRRHSNRKFGIYYFDKYNIETKRKEKFYEMKEDLLDLASPEAIHKLEYENGDVKYFLLYKVDQYCLHSMIYEAEIDEFFDLPIVKLESFDTYGRTLADLMSVQFVRKMLKLVQTGAYKIV